jgi:hypothetical protein
MEYDINGHLGVQSHKLFIDAPRCKELTLQVEYQNNFLLCSSNLLSISFFEKFEFAKFVLILNDNILCIVYKIHNLYK